MPFKPGIERTKVNHVEYLGSSIFSDCGKELAIGTGRYSDHRLQMGAIMLNKFDSIFLLLPQFEMAIDGCGDQEIRPVGKLESFVDEGVMAYTVTTQKLITSRCMKLL